MSRSCAALAIPWIAAAAMACSSTPDDPQTPGPDGGGPPDAGPEDWGCPAGQLDSEGDGTCRAPGIAAGECGEGFTHDGADACDAVLPEAPCGEGTMAIPGETSCRVVAPCGEGTWGDIPVDATTQHVDATYAGTDSDGTADKPWTTVQAAVNAAAEGAIVAIGPGSYLEHVLVQNKAVRLWGKCPAETEIAGPADSLFVVDIRGGADGAEVRDLAITGDGLGLAVAGSLDVIGDRLWIHGTSDAALSVQNFGGKTGATLRRSLVEAAGDIGVYGIGSAITVEESVIRDTLPDPAQTFGRGITVASDPVKEAPTELIVRRSIIAGGHEGNIFVFGSVLLLEDSLVRDTKGSAADELGGDGVAVMLQTDTGQRGSATIRRSIVQGARSCGVCATDSDLDIEATVIRDTQPRLADGDLGIGLLAVDTEVVEEGQSTAAVRRSVVERAHMVGLGTAGLDANIESVVVRDVELRASDGLIGRGISIENNSNVAIPVIGSGLVRGCRIERASESGLTFVGTRGAAEWTLVRDIEPRGDGFMGRGINAEIDPISGTPASLSLDRVDVEATHEFGIFVVGSEATIDRAVVRDTRTRPADQAGGAGVAIQFSYETGAPSKAIIRRTTVENSHQSGVSVMGATADLDQVVVRDSKPIGDGSFGDGLLVALVLLDPFVLTTKATVTSSSFEHSARAGISSFGAEISLGTSRLECNPIQLDGESFDGHSFALADVGGNVCGCDGASVECQVLTSNLAAPDPVK